MRETLQSCCCMRKLCQKSSPQLVVRVSSVVVMSCSMQEAARAAGRHISILRSAGASPDHPIDPGYPEGAYLKNVLLLVT